MPGGVTSKDTMDILKEVGGRNTEAASQKLRRREALLRWLRDSQENRNVRSSNTNR